MEKRLELMKRHKISIADDDDGIELTEQQKLNMAVITVFQKIDDLNTAAGGTDMDWFLNLPITHLKIFYKELEDIWNYRAELTPTMKSRIVPNNNIFKKTAHAFFLFYEAAPRCHRHLGGRRGHTPVDAQGAQAGRETLL